MRAPVLHTPLKPIAPLPAWARQGPISELRLGALLAHVQPAACGGAPSGVWRQRLAMRAALAHLRLEGRSEDEPTLRDHWYLRREGDDPGPAGNILKAWRSELTIDPERLAQLLALPREGVADLLDRADEAGSTRGTPYDPAIALAFQAQAKGRDWRGFSMWLADRVMARRLGWPGAVSILALNLPRNAFRVSAYEDFYAAALPALIHGTLEAVVLYDDLVRRGEKLALGAQKMRSKDTRATIYKLLSEDAVMAEAGAQTSDRAARRMLTGLADLGLIRELSGRASFRLWGI